MAKTEEKKANWGTLGGNQHMHGFAPTGKQEPGVSSQEGHSGSRKDIKVQAGPSDVIGYSSGATNKDYAGTQEPGTSGRTKTGPNNKFAEGGKTHMWGNRGSRKMPEGQSGPNG
jgi:hypothetical protein